MKFKKIMTVLLALCAIAPGLCAQSTVKPLGAPNGGTQTDGWDVNVRLMPDSTREEITEAMNKLSGSLKNKGIISDVLQSVGLGLVSGFVEAVVSETYNLVQYRKKQKQEWQKMIQNENNFTDSITYIKGLRDFYTENSLRGALDPSNINFNGIEIRGMRNGKEVIYMSCSIDLDKIDHMFRHSKFNLVLDTLAFYPMECHLPNISANGIKTMKKIKKRKSKSKGENDAYIQVVKGDTILRPGVGGNGFSFDERKNLNVGIEFSLYSSWINEAIQVHKDVELGNFKFNVNIPNTEKYIYSRKKVLNEAKNYPEGIERENFITMNSIGIEGDSFVVPRSYMPLDSIRPMWGTGEYNVKVKIRESCNLADNSEKAKNWHEDYKRLRQMQDKSGEVKEYVQTLWNQYGYNLVKTSYKTALSTVATDLTKSLSSGSSMQSGGGGQGAP